ncbi:hypothetical protein O181_063423 [Austropuccinia psidii MF-1]|uniref:Uncharacterized protein n=1 Tax=Austropuccinia psidii MF-1 TaxID=1389203 RepID=A0A9Q3ERL8_9BASI|nr:hypothetical protein [Austropuccinia psidii MF-1]
MQNLQEAYFELRKGSEETNKRLKKVLEEKYHCKRDRECLDQEMNKLFNVCRNIRPQSQGNGLENTPYQQEDIKPDSLWENKPRSQSKYQDRYNMNYSEKEALSQLLESSSWPKFTGVVEYDNMELIDYIYGLLIDVKTIPKY